MNKIIIAKQFEFEAAHQLPDIECYGKCRNLHGHTYRLIVEIFGEIDDKGWVMNFKDLKNIVKELVIDKYDHVFLNDFFPLSTAEIIAMQIFNDLKFKLNIHSITLYETSNSYVRIEG